MFTLQAFYHLLFHARQQHLLFVTNPPITMWMAPFFKIFYGCRYSLLIYDIYPDVLIGAGILSKNSLFATLWRKMNALTLREAKNVITLSDGMVETLRKQMTDGRKLNVTVIKNWVDTNFFKPVPQSENSIIQEFNLKNKFIVAYTGSFGATHGVKNIVKCAEILRDCPDIHFILVGGGTEGNSVRKSVLEKGLANLTILAFQPRERFRYLTAAVDASIILLKSGAGKSIMPSKVYTALSAGSAILAAAEVGSDLARMIERHECGIVIPPEDPKAMSDSILRLARDSRYLSELKNNARNAAVKFYAKENQVKKYADLFIDLV